MEAFQHALSRHRKIGVWWPTITQEEPVLQITATFTDAQIKTLPTTPLVVVPAPGAGKYLVPVLATIETTVLNPYTNITDQTENQGASDLVITYADNWENAFRAVPFTYFNVFHANRRIAICPPFMTLQVPTVAADQLWAHTLDYNENANHLENTPLKLSCDNSGDLTGGDPGNSVVVTVLYIIRTWGVA